MQYLQAINNKKAFALSIVLWIVAALLMGVASLTIFSKDSMQLSEGLNNKIQTQLKVEEVLEVLKFYIITADYNNNFLINETILNIPYKFPKKIVLDNRWYYVNENIRIRILDTSALINTFGSIQSIANIATNQLQNQLKYRIEDSIKDWKDTDSIVELNGAESSTYEFKKEVNFKIRNNSDIQDPQEFKLIHGIDSLSDLQWKYLKSKLYNGRQLSPSLLFVDKIYLAYLLDISDSYAKTLIDIRKKDINEFINIVSKLNKFVSGDIHLYISKQLKIEIQTTIVDATTILNTIIDFKPSEYKQYTTILYTIK